MNDKFIDEYDYENVQRKLMNSFKDEGYNEGLSNGVTIGEKKAKLEDAKKMLDEGLDIDLISRVTGITKEDINKLRQD